MLSKFIKEFVKNHLVERRGSYHSTDNSRILTEKIPAFLKEKLGVGDEYKIYGSVGSGNWSEIPWIAILDKTLTESTEKGYYIVVLFDSVLKNIYLGLAAGWTQFKEEYGGADGKQKIRSFCDHYGQKILTQNSRNFNIGLIDLGAKNELGKGYESGLICFKKYSIDGLQDEILVHDIDELLDLYFKLKNIVGSSILNLDINFQEKNKIIDDFNVKIANSSLEIDTKKAFDSLLEVANNYPPEIRIKLKKEIVRNRKFADFVKSKANFVCEVCGRKPFIQKNGKFYAEADHIVPLGVQGFDNPDNMRCLCAQCHAVITHGSSEEIKMLLENNSE